MSLDIVLKLLNEGRKRIVLMIKDAWPSITTMLGDFLRGTIVFLKETIISVFKSR
jgi:hypothetical protein